jgi:hypothetical protein
LVIGGVLARALIACAKALSGLGCLGLVAIVLL